MPGAELRFTHAPLDKARQHIRLISVIPEPSGEIKCQLKNAYLDDNTTPDYRALSYMWGPPTPLRQIEINGRYFEVRLNLFTFLEAFRQRTYKFRGNENFAEEVQWLWVDQICIDQNVIEERNHQVMMMSQIYQRATYVYIWLGSSNKSMEEAMRALKSDLRRYYEKRIERSSRAKGRSNELAVKGYECHNQDDPHQQPHLHHLRNFFDNQYWKRLWIVQEVMLARYIRIICGETLLSWEELSRFCLSYKSQIQCSIPHQMVWPAKHALSAKTYTYTDLLATFSSSQCHDLKDKVYGLQGLLHPLHRIDIDYAQSTETIFQSAAYMMREDAKAAAPFRLGEGLSDFDYTKPASSTFLEASLVLNEEIKSRVGIPPLSTLVGLREEMGLRPWSLYPATWAEIEKDLQSSWTGIVDYYYFLRHPIPWDRDYVKPDLNDYTWSHSALIQRTKSLGTAYLELAGLLYIMEQPESEYRCHHQHGSLKGTCRDCTKHCGMFGPFSDATLFKDYSFSHAFQEELMDALERTAFRQMAASRI